MGVITIGAQEFVRGVSFTDDLPDAGFSPEDKVNNPKIYPGKMTSGFLYTEMSNEAGNLATDNKIIASVSDGATLSPNLLYFVSKPAGNNANFYKWNAIGNEPTLEQTDSGARNYEAGITDMAYFGTDIFVTSKTDIAKLTNNLGALDEDWWSTVAGTAVLENGFSHPMIEFDKKLWIGDKSALHYWDGSAGVEDHVDFGYNNYITAIGISEQTGDMLVAVQDGLNVTAGGSRKTKILIYDGVNPVPNKEIRVNEKVTAFYNLGGITYVFYGKNFGFFNGSGITHIRTLNIDYDIDEIIHPHKVTSHNDTLYITEVDDVLAYGKIYPRGNRVFYYPYTGGVTRINMIKYFGADSLAIGKGPQSAPSFGYIDTETNESGKLWRSNKYYLPSNSKITKVEIISDVLQAGDIIQPSLYVSSDNTADNLSSMNFATDGAITEKTVGRNVNIETTYVQIRIYWSGTRPVPIRQIKIHYDPIEKPI